jgi:hypothetical protein
MHLTWATGIAGLVLWLGRIPPGQTLTTGSKLLPTYDYVVVGAGVSGLTVANRLSENKKLSVLVIEAGGLYVPYFLFYFCSLQRLKFKRY